MIHRGDPRSPSSVPTGAAHSELAGPRFGERASDQSGSARAAVFAQLQARQGEIEKETLARIYRFSDPSESGPVYLDGLRKALSTAIDHGLSVIEQGEERSPAVPQILLLQAQLAARNGVNLDTVLRRYIAGKAILLDFLLREAEIAKLRGASLQGVIRDLATTLDLLLAGVSEAYLQESKNRLRSTKERRGERVRRLLSGELIDTSGLGYDFNRWHLAAIATGPGAAEVLRRLASALGQPLLLIPVEEENAWVWLGGHKRGDMADLELISSVCSTRNRVAIGESAQGLTGWRLSHRQAKAALAIALRSEENIVRYTDVALLASALQDELLSASLHEQFLAPLLGERDGGERFRATLRALFSTNRNISSAAAKLGVSPRTVYDRLRAIEERLGRPLNAYLPEIETALRLEDFDLASYNAHQS